MLLVASYVETCTMIWYSDWIVSLSCSVLRGKAASWVSRASLPVTLVVGGDCVRRAGMDHLRSRPSWSYRDTGAIVDEVADLLLKLLRLRPGR